MKNVATWRVRTCIIFSAIAAANGCAVTTEYSVSAPLQGSRLHDPKNHRLEIDGLKLHIQPQNAVPVERTVYFIIVPISSEKGPPIFRSKPLEVDFYVYAETSGFSFVPKDILLFVNSSEPVRPTLIAGPIDGKNQVGGPLLRSIGRAFGRVQCRSGKGSQETRPTENEISIDDLEEWLCYKLYFPIDPPSPDENIEIRVSGLRKNQTIVDPPIIIKYTKSAESYHQ